VAIAGDPDQVIALTQFLVELEMKPVYVITGSPGNQFEKRLHEILDGPVPNAKIKQTADLFELHQWMKNEPVDLLIGNTYGKHMARTENVPFVRFGFPVLDRTGHRFFPTVGYMGAVNLINQMINVLLDKKDRECEEEWFELVQ
jgi:nitrogenase molybdenum-iron protein beta chain